MGSESLLQARLCTATTSRWCHCEVIRRSKLGELLEREDHPNQQRSLGYIQGTFNDYLRGKAPLITGLSAQLFVKAKMKI